MSTEDVPGYKPENRDKLAMGCWAEHKDGSMIVVESVEGGRVIYSIFDTAKKPVIEYRDGMKELDFKRAFSWRSGEALTKDPWTWHDKTPFPWDKIIKQGARDGARHADVEEMLTQAEQVRRKRQKYGLRDEEPTREAEDEYFEDNAAQRSRRARDLQVGRPVDPAEFEHRMERVMGKAAKSIVEGVQRAISRLAPGKTKR